MASKKNTELVRELKRLNQNLETLIAVLDQFVTLYRLTHHKKIRKTLKSLKPQ